MVDIVLLVVRILLIAFLFVFLFLIMKTGIGLVQGQRKSGRVWTIAVERGPKELRGVKIRVNSAVVIGRAPGADIVIGASFVSARHARISPIGDDLILEDLNSTNGTLVNGERITAPYTLEPGDIISIGDVNIKASCS